MRKGQRAENAVTTGTPKIVGDDFGYMKRTIGNNLDGTFKMTNDFLGMGRKRYCKQADEKDSKTLHSRLGWANTLRRFVGLVVGVF